MDWMKIGSAVLLFAMIVFMWPRAMHAMKNSPKAKGNDWLMAALPIVGVVLFVLLLMKLV